MRSRLSYANVVASLALFISLGGVSYAAIKLPARSVGNAHLKDRAVSQRTLDRSLRARFAAAGPTGAAGAVGAPGHTGPAGPRGVQGERGPAGTNASFNGVTAGGDLTGTFPAPSLKADAVTSAKVLDGSLTGVDIDESSLGEVPVATKLAGVETEDLARGDGRLVSQVRSLPYLPAVGDVTAVVAGSFVAGDLQFRVLCANQHATLGTTARAQVLNISQGPAYFWFDDGVASPQWVVLAPGQIHEGPSFEDSSRRSVVQGVSQHADFFISLVGSQDGAGCRAAMAGFTSDDSSATPTRTGR
jgi:hypothetical protein